MSAGLKGDPLPGCYTTGAGWRRHWAGNDGKYESLPSGKQRSRWNNYNVVIASWRRSDPDNWISVRGDGVQVTTPVAAAYNPYLGDIPNSLELSAQSKLAEKIKGHSFNLAVNAAQSKQLVDMVVTNLGQLGRSILALKRGDFATAARALGTVPRASRLKPSDISGRWLELQYGWLPTLSDTYEAAKAYEKITKDERQFTFRASASSTDEVDMSCSPGDYSVKIGVKYRVNIVAEIYEELSASRSMGLQDPLSLAWEVLPYSFVVDWFVPIGTYLETLNVLPFLKGRFSTTRSSMSGGAATYTFLGTIPGYIGGVYYSSINHVGSYVCRGVYSSRVITTGLSPTLPSFDSSGLHGKRIWNAIALAYQRFH